MDDVRLDRLEQRLEDLDRRESALEKAMDRSRAAVNTVVPSETRRHMKAAWRENLLAVRSFIDYWAEKLNDQPEQQKGPADSGRENIRID